MYGLVPFCLTNVERIFEVFFYDYLNERHCSDDSDKVVLFTPMTPIIYSDKHKKKKNGRTFRYVRILAHTILYIAYIITSMFLQVDLYSHRSLV